MKQGLQRSAPASWCSRWHSCSHVSQLQQGVWLASQNARWQRRFLARKVASTSHRSVNRLQPVEEPGAAHGIARGEKALLFKLKCLNQTCISLNSIMQLAGTIFSDSAIFMEKKRVENRLWPKSEFLWPKKIKRSLCTSVPYQSYGCSNDVYRCRDCAVDTKTLGPCAFS